VCLHAEKFWAIHRYCRTSLLGLRFEDAAIGAPQSCRQSCSSDSRMIKLHHLSFWHHFVIPYRGGFPVSPGVLNRVHREGLLAHLAGFRRWSIPFASRFLALASIGLVHVQLLFQRWILAFAFETFAVILSDWSSSLYQISASMKLSILRSGSFLHQYVDWYYYQVMIASPDSHHDHLQFLQ